MVIYCKNGDTGLIHKIMITNWDTAEYCSTPVDKIPEGEKRGGYFLVVDNTIILLGPQMFLGKAIKTKETD